MKALEVIEKIKGILGIELSEQTVQLATMKLDNGTEIMTEGEFVKDKEVFIVGEEGEKIALPVGEYTMEDGKVLSVIEEGLINEIKEEAAEEEVVEEQAEEEVEAEAEEAKVKSKTESTQVVYATKEEVDEVKSMIAEIKTLLEKEKEVEQVEMAAEVAEPIAHNPEAVSEPKSNLPHQENNQLSRIRQMIYNK
jgi:hypothetical protein